MSFTHHKAALKHRPSSGVERGGLISWPTTLLGYHLSYMLNPNTAGVSQKSMAQQSHLLTHRGKATTSRMFCRPDKYPNSRSNPSPKPP